MAASVLSVINRSNPLLLSDISNLDSQLCEMVAQSRFLVLGAAGTIGQAVVKELFKREPKTLHVVDISENNLVELVRDIRSSYGYINGEFQTYALDIGSLEFDAMIAQGSGYDYVLNLSALKHVRSEKDPFTLMRMINVNIINTVKTLQQAINFGAKKYFCVSTDKAANPVNMMGASKRIMEMFLMQKSNSIAISMARFANVAFSDGSLLHGFDQRISKLQPIVAPNDIERYFITPEESGQLCLISCLLGENRDILFPKVSDDFTLTTFSKIAERYIESKNYQVELCTTEVEAREKIKTLPGIGKWPCLFSKSDTTGEKYIEEFYTDSEVLDMDKYEKLGVIKNIFINNEEALEYFLSQIEDLKRIGRWDKKIIVDLFRVTIPGFNHEETGKYLDGKM